jgi:hypothetical protein
MCTRSRRWVPELLGSDFLRNSMSWTTEFSETISEMTFGTFGDQLLIVSRSKSSQAQARPDVSIPVAQAQTGIIPWVLLYCMIGWLAVLAARLPGRTHRLSAGGPAGCARTTQKAGRLGVRIFPVRRWRMAVQCFLPGHASPFADLLVRTVYLRVPTKEIDLSEKRLPSTGGGGTLASS